MVEGETSKIQFYDLKWSLFLSPCHCAHTDKERCQVMFDYAAFAEDELDMKKGDIVTILSKVWTHLFVHVPALYR